MAEDWLLSTESETHGKLYSAFLIEMTFRGD